MNLVHRRPQLPDLVDHHPTAGRQRLDLLSKELRIAHQAQLLAIEEKKFDYTTNERLRKALELKLFEDQKDSIKLSSLVSQVIDKETQEKIEVVKDRLIKNYGYCDLCATNVLSYVASIFARGDAKEST